MEPVARGIRAASTTEWHYEGDDCKDNTEKSSCHEDIKT